ncbi:MAG: hypothetical protein ACREE6_18525, partial [Limisphaerales bacterium]
LLGWRVGGLALQRLRWLWVSEVTIVHFAEQPAKQTREILFEIVGQCAHVLATITVPVCRPDLSRKRAKEVILKNMVFKQALMPIRWLKIPFGRCMICQTNN